VGEGVVVAGIGGDGDTARIEVLRENSPAGIVDLHLIEVAAHLRVDVKAAVSCGAVDTDERNLEVSAEGAKAGSTVLGIRFDVSHRHAAMQVPSTRIEPCQISTCLITAKSRARFGVAGDVPRESCDARDAGGIGVDAATDTAGPHPTADLIGLRIGRSADER